jgi:hypothetical protein
MTGLAAASKFGQIRNQVHAAHSRHADAGLLLEPDEIDLLEMSKVVLCVSMMRFNEKEAPGTSG